MYLSIAITALAFIVAGGLFWASYSIRSGVYVKALCRKKTSAKVVALTFDDGIDPVRTPRVLDILKRENILATFFVIGERAEKHPEIVRRIVGEGHSVGNHSYGHTPRFPMMSRRRIAEDLARCHKVLEEATGNPPALFRPPYGVTNPMVAGAVADMGYRVMGWSIRSLDTMGGPREKVLRRISRRLHGGAVILLHDDRPDSDRLLEMVIEMLRGKGYSILRADLMFETETDS